MNEQNNQTTRQTEQNTNDQSQQSGTQNRNNGGFPGFFFPLNFIFGERPRRPNENNSQQDDSQGAQQQQQQQQEQQQQEEEQQQNHHHHHRNPQVQFFIYPISGDGQNTPAGVFFFSPFFIPQEVRKPRASESAINNLPIITITKEHVDSQASCPICFEPFPVSIGQEENKKEESQNVVRQMPCNHMFCESCLFQWLRQNNTCPLCRKEIEAEEPQTQQNDNNATDNTFPPFIQIINVNDSLPTSPPLSTTTSTTATTTTNTEQSNSNSNNNNITQNSHSSCALETVGCCEETDNNVSTPIITLPQCHHRFHASCLRTSLLVEGYSLGDFNSISQPLNFHCPTCRAPAIVQSDVLKMPTIPQNNERQEQQVIPFNLPITIHIPESDDMDLD